MGREEVSCQRRGTGRFFSGVAKVRMKGGSAGSVEVRISAFVSVMEM